MKSINIENDRNNQNKNEKLSFTLDPENPP
jgi:hypothetical protein